MRENGRESEEKKRIVIYIPVDFGLKLGAREGEASDRKRSDAGEERREETIAMRD